MKTEVIVIGGGLAGLIAALELTRAGIEVLVIEKRDYPRHKVCGEYVSNEVRSYLVSLGLSLKDLAVTEITRLEVSSPSGTILNAPLESGGFGVSRYRLEQVLYQLCRDKGVEFLLNTSVSSAQQSTDGSFDVLTNHGNRHTARLLIGAYGKKSSLDVKQNRRFTESEAPYLAVKYHIRYEHPKDAIYLHNFKDGYCGMSAIEDGKSCLCYLTRRSNLKGCGGSLAKLEEIILARNPHLSAIFTKAEFLYEKPLVINGFSFHKKEIVENGILMIGDAAGLIPPLSGNGMAMAIHGARMLSAQIVEYIKNDHDFNWLERGYRRQWNSTFATRLRAGRLIQYSFGKEWTTELIVRMAGSSEWITKKLIGLTHGREISSR